MKVSVLIIARNEEKHIAGCIESVLHQTKKADEIVLIAHNCTDRTETIARNYPIMVVSFAGGSTVTDARIEGLCHVSGDIILCTDGDSSLASNWVDIMSALLCQENILVGSWVKIKGSFHARVSNLWNYFFCKTKGRAARRWIWGASMGFWGRDKEFVREVFEKSIRFSKELGLSRTADDYWLALFMQRRGNIEVTNKTWVSAFAAETTSVQSVHRNYENHRNGALIATFFNSLPHN
jgi:glycosyltransferase involved in cell wall biosynthesis